jgi:hypothetical protein
VTYGWDTNTLDSTFSASNTAGRLATVQYSDYLNNFSAGTDPWLNSTSYLEEYSYAPSGLVAAKRFQVTHNMQSSGGDFSSPFVNLDVDYAYL